MFSNASCPLPQKEAWLRSVRTQSLPEQREKRKSLGNEGTFLAITHTHTVSSDCS